MNDFFNNLYRHNIFGLVAQALSAYSAKCNAEIRAYERAEKLMDEYQLLAPELKKLMEKAANEM